MPPAATVSVFGVSEAVSDQDFHAYMTELAGDLVTVTRSSAVHGCRLAEYWDVRSANMALAKLNGSQARVPTIVEVCCLAQALCALFTCVHWSWDSLVLRFVCPVLLSTESLIWCCTRCVSSPGELIV